MNRLMRAVLTILSSSCVLLVLVLLAWMASRPVDPVNTARAANVAATQPTSVLKLGIVPERDVFAQRTRYLALAGHLQKTLGRPAELVTLNSYELMLDELQTRQVDIAFLGSLLAVVANDRLGAVPLVKPIDEAGVSEYHGQLIVKEDSPIKTVQDLAGKKLSLMRATYASALYPIAMLKQSGVMTSTSTPRFIWAGTHEEVIRDVFDGRADAGAAKDTVLTSMLSDPGAPRVRVIAQSKPAPNHALVIRSDLASTLGTQIQKILLTMNDDDTGRATLKAFGARGFVTCELSEFAGVVQTINDLGDDWPSAGIAGPAPRVSIAGQKPSTQESH